MCTLFIAREVYDASPLVIAANRDEWYARAASAPARFSETAEGVQVLAGRDLVAQGTWMGTTREGFFVAVTNQRTFAAPKADARSRGALVADLLRAGSHREARRLIEGIDGREYNGFNVIFGDARAVSVAYGRPSEARVELEEVPVGMHVLPNDRLDSRTMPKVERVLELAPRDVHLAWPELGQALARMLGDHQTPAPESVDAPPSSARFDLETVVKLHAVCIHTPVYGTRSATLLAMAPGKLQHYEFAEGAACVTPFVSVA